MKAKRWILATITLTVTVVTGISVYAYNQPKTPQTAPETVTEQVKQPEPPTRAELLKLVNAERKEVGVKPLKLSDKLNKSAQYKADDMVKRHYFEHEDPKTGKNNGLDYLNKIYSKCTWVSENLSRNNYGDFTAQDTFAGWVQSTKHYEAIVDSRYDLTGIGFSGDYAVQHFCDLD